MSHFDNSGYLFRNEKRTSDKSPNMKGKFTSQGTDFWVAGWTNSRDGKPYISIALTEVADADHKYIGNLIQHGKGIEARWQGKIFFDDGYTCQLEGAVSESKAGKKYLKVNIGMVSNALDDLEDTCEFDDDVPF